LKRNYLFSVAKLQQVQPLKLNKRSKRQQNIKNLHLIFPQKGQPYEIKRLLLFNKLIFLKIESYSAKLSFQQVWERVKNVTVKRCLFRFFEAHHKHTYQDDAKAY
tara:strand:+ start:711 stop:1025 length:315 start_codon:yes stop_codon:yes gene_type:complete